MADTLREQARLTDEELATRIDDYWDLYVDLWNDGVISEDDYDSGYEYWKLEAQQEKDFNLFLQSLKQVKPLGDEETANHLRRMALKYHKSSYTEFTILQRRRYVAQASHQYVIDQIKSLIGVKGERN